ncbi:MAG: UDP-N-acetylmuramoyl-L-alanine--D-glutamate ligase [Hyphomicrobiaceae bacterium]|nr:UDP-N-acetylmuramoyl-L-alanine--D-glutamate ligase [Hyphomicrobiaceae bacterium]
MIRASTFAGKRVAVLGLGGSGTATVASLVAGGADVAAWDDGERSRIAAEKSGVPLVDLRVADWSDFSALVLAPGVPLTHPKPHWTVERAQAAGIEVIGDIEIFCRERRAHAPGSPLIAITGTNGKSTTTALIAHILKSAGIDAQMGGNIGVPILSLEEPLAAPSAAEPSPAPRTATAPRVHVIEMSSFQIDLTPSLDPTIGVLLNLSPDHLDRHGPADDAGLAMRRYAAIKERLVMAAEVALVGVDDEHCLAVLQRRVAAGPAAPLSVKRAIRPGYSVHEGRLICADATGLALNLGTTTGITTLRGLHNTQNALAAVAAVRELGNRLGWLLTIDWQAALAGYPGLPHRMEQVGRLGRVVFINDSKATNADSTEKALASWDREIFWILGGKPKEGGIRPLEPYFGRVAKAYLIGAASDDFAATLDGRVAYERCGTLDVALVRAASDASLSTEAEPVVLLSPACASYDQFRSFEHRGDTFRALVQAMPGVIAGAHR